ncbi:hypothetical protein AaE_014077 [Aphanomyces astaci]|uniref:PiggyBac transposable element-derived protein domain-containing protein n=1 Tax=Aphanomyces astaci TaxID=112090 RepID=A0A6A4Z8H8_APHAT|nr:hypothetical protein AaE_014077 [Aphanomyces astaci]
MEKSKQYTFAKVWKVLKSPPYNWRSKRPTGNDLNNDWLYYCANVSLRGEQKVVDWALSHLIFDKDSTKPMQPATTDSSPVARCAFSSCLGDVSSATTLECVQCGQHVHESCLMSLRDAMTTNELYFIDEVTCCSAKCYSEFRVTCKPRNDVDLAQTLSVCVALGCDLDASLATQPCTMCGKPVHHICSNEIAPDPEDMSLRFCSPLCWTSYGVKKNGTVCPQTPQRARDLLRLPPTPPDDVPCFASPPQRASNWLGSQLMPPEHDAGFESNGAHASKSPTSTHPMSSGGVTQYYVPEKKGVAKRTFKVGSLMWQKQENKKKREAEKEELKKTKLKERTARALQKDAHKEAKKRRDVLRNTMPPATQTNSTPDLKVAIRPETARVQSEPRTLPPKSLLREGSTRTTLSTCRNGGSFLQRIEHDVDFEKAPSPKRSKTAGNPTKSTVPVEIGGARTDGVDSDMSLGIAPNAEEEYEGLDSGDESEYDQDGYDLPFDDGMAFGDELEVPYVQREMDEYPVDGTGIEDLTRTSDHFAGCWENGLKGSDRVDVLHEMSENGWECIADDSYVEDAPDAFDDDSEQWGPSPDVIPFAHSPIGLFFHFFPKWFWRHVARETTNYEIQSRPERLFRHERSYSSEQHEAYRRKANKFQEVRPLEVVHLVAMLVFRCVMPIKSGIKDHWRREEYCKGLEPPGTFGKVMSRNRFVDICRYVFVLYTFKSYYLLLTFLHFNNNLDPRARTDRAWKVRSISDMLQKTSAGAFKLGRYISFDEAVIPGRASMHSYLMYFKDKPHKFGTKLFMVCCGKTAFCARFEIYCGKKMRGPNSVPPSENNDNGAAAVHRNLKALFNGRDQTNDMDKKRYIVCDREYTSYTLVRTLLDNGFYCIGTCCPTRLGFPLEIVWPSKARVDRGAYNVAKSQDDNPITALAWRDNGNVYFLASGASTKPTTVLRRSKRGPESMHVPCPTFVETYNNTMNGADVHDQIRLQRYPLQATMRFKKYYKSVALGLIDIGLVNMYIIHREVCKANGRSPMTHGSFRRLLSQQLCDLDNVDFENDDNPADLDEPCDEDVLNNPSEYAPPSDFNVAPIYVPKSEHIMVQTEELRSGNKLNARSCFVCSWLKSNGKLDRTRQTTTYCKQCSDKNVHARQVFLCMKPRAILGGLTCCAYYHDVWKCKRPKKVEVCD